MLAMTRPRNDTGTGLAALLQGIAAIPAGLDVRVTGICADSRVLSPGAVFLALRGQRDHGWRHAAEAVRAGARAVLVEADAAMELPVPAGIPVIRIAGLAAQAGVIAARFYGDPSRHMKVVGITGTNGKTSTSHYIAAALDGFSGGRGGIIGTLGYGPVGRTGPAHLTTPDPVALQAELARQLALDVHYVAMEVSSHALQQGRIAGMHFHTAVFTNLTRDHLDFHGDMAAYGAAKRRLFEHAGLAHAVVNLDDAFGRALHSSCAGRVPVIGYRLLDAGQAAAGSGAELVGTLRPGEPGALALDVTGPWGRGLLRALLTGRFNAANLLAACATLCVLGVPFDTALALLARVRAVPGRMEAFRAPGRPLVVVDYAHTPDAVEQALRALRPQCRGRLVCVFGCGGDRDPGKRPQMGAVAEAHADVTVITSDNPRSEDPDAIIAAILAGMHRPAAALVEPDRAAAIGRAIGAAGVEDIVLVAGKGHETTQEIAGRKFPFSDRQVVRRLLGMDP